MRRMMSVWLPDWATARQRLRSPPPAAPGEPLVVVEAVDGVRRIASLDDPARACGLLLGQRLTDALAIRPGLATAAAEPEEDRRALDALADWAQRFTPAAAADPPEGLFLDVTGCAHLFAGEAALAGELEAALARRSIPARIGLADTAGAAWALARHAGAPVAIAAAGTQRARMAKLPVASLRLDPDTVHALRRLGLERVGDLAGLSRASLTRRFGTLPSRRLDQALGAAGETIEFRRPETPWFERLAFAEPIATPEDLARALALLAERLCLRLRGAAKGGARFTAAFHRVDGGIETIAVATALAARDAQRLAKLLGEKLERVDPGFGVEVATLAAGRVERMPETQRALPGAPAGTEDLAQLVDTLGNRIGFERLWRVAPRESHLPEREVARLAPLARGAGRSWAADRPRPVRLLPRPEPIEAVAPIPDDPPVLFRWRGVLRRVRRAEGPERIAFEWWRQRMPAGRAEPDLVRDYYRVEDTEGGRFWIYRAGLYAPDRKARWFLHGLFG